MEIDIVAGVPEIRLPYSLPLAGIARCFGVAMGNVGFIVRL
jgi:hypothetical protein